MADTLVKRLYAFIDYDKSGHVEIWELIRAINPLLRGSLEHLAAMLFDIYDVDNVSAIIL